MFIHLKSWVAPARRDFMWVKIYILNLNNKELNSALYGDKYVEPDRAVDESFLMWRAGVSLNCLILNQSPLPDMYRQNEVKFGG